MNRNHFLKKLASVSAIISLPFTALASLQFNRKNIDKGFKVSAGKDRADKPLNLFEGDTFYNKVASGDTDGALYVFESSRIREGGPALHLHYDQDECWYILQGEFLFKIGDELFTAKVGDTLFGPRNVPHAFAKVGEGEARLLISFQPAGRMQEMFSDIARGVTNNMTEAEQEKFRHEHGIKRVGPPLAATKKW